MKTYIFTLSLYHETFGGHDSYDGTTKFEILARNENSARNKLSKLAKDYNNGCRWYNIQSMKIV